MSERCKIVMYSYVCVPELCDIEGFCGFSQSIQLNAPLVRKCPSLFSAVPRCLVSAADGVVKQTAETAVKAYYNCVCVRCMHVVRACARGLPWLALKFLA